MTDGRSAGAWLGGLVLVSLVLGSNTRAAPAARFSVATRLPRRPAADGQSQRNPYVTMSEGWACARFDSELGVIKQCWDAGPKPRAWLVPWLQDRLYYGPDRVCEHDVSGLTFRCWHRPRRGELQPRDMPAKWQWLNPHGAKWDDSYNRSDRLGDVFMGGTFACLRTPKDSRVFCLGDDRFGQLGSSKPPRPDAGPDDPAFLRGVGPEVSPALGTWHGCALAVPRGIDQDIPVLCWGRGDYGQLGAPAPDRCLVDGRSVPCARTPVRGPVVKDQMMVLQAGDLFTCMTTDTGIKCWGASRDGLFGVPGSCPEKLRREWPTPSGPVRAPNASCTATPVQIPGTTEFDPHFTVRPRQICFASGGSERCLSGVPKPRDRKIAHYKVSPGSDASACAVRGEGVICWGENYSPPSAPDEPVPITFEPLPPIGDMAIIGDLDATRWKPKCQIQRPCYEPVRKLPPCEGKVNARSAAEILSSASSLAGQIVSARGPLGVGELTPSRRGGGLISCDRTTACCDGVSASVVLGADNGTLAVGDLRCSGDESRVCCNAPAYGQTVVATGRLSRDRDATGPGTSGWRLLDVRLCEEARKAD